MRRLINRPFLIKTLGWTAATLAVAGLGAAVKFAPKPDTAQIAAHIDSAIVDISAALGMKLNALTVEGRAMTAREDLLAAMDSERGAPILSIDVANARAAIEALPWVKTAQVERRLPDAVHILLEERTPYALWQQGNRYTLVDQTGKAIVDVPEADQTLPLIVGPDAPAHVAALFETLAVDAELASRVRAAVRVGARRWNVYLDSFEGGISIRLPEDNIGGAWTRLAALEREHKILQRDLDFIDMRLEDRLVVKVHKDPAAEAAAAATAVTKKKPVVTGPKQNI
ncbi:MAG: FtsQ-type POTRA domain-containing protein [Rhodospirillaceae bacterium]|nr:FtsQ-type POTRA domain-containing protein [Rhodospirillaceae bacterium]